MCVCVLSGEEADWQIKTDCFLPDGTRDDVELKRFDDASAAVAESLYRV